MKISTKGRYALRMIVDMLQHQENGPVALKDVAERQNISKKYLEQIALTLAQKDIMRGSRGHLGGYRVIGDPTAYTVYDILEITEGSLHPVACLDAEKNACERCHGCETLYIWQELDSRIQEYLRSMTIQDVVDTVVARNEAKAKKD